MLLSVKFASIFNEDPMSDLDEKVSESDNEDDDTLSLYEKFGFTDEEDGALDSSSKSA